MQGHSLVEKNLLLEPVEAAVEVLEAGRGGGGLADLDAGVVVLEEARRLDLRQLKVSLDRA